MWACAVLADEAGASKQQPLSSVPWSNNPHLRSYKIHTEKWRSANVFKCDAKWSFTSIHVGQVGTNGAISLLLQLQITLKKTQSACGCLVLPDKFTV